jgi:hypothetical protein
VNANFTCEGGFGQGSGANVPFGCYRFSESAFAIFLEAASGGARCTSGQRAFQGTRGGVADGDPESKWCLIHGGKPVQWQIDAGRELRPGHYAFTSAEDVPARDPRIWRLEGSKDGVSWSLLDERNEEPVFERRHQQKHFELRQPALCRFFRFTFQPNPGVEHFQVAEISIEGVETRSWKPRRGKYRRELTGDGNGAGEFERAVIRADAPCQCARPVFVSRLTACAGAPSRLKFPDRPERFTTTCQGPNELLMTGTLNDGRGGKASHTPRVRVLARAGRWRRTVALP